MENGETADIAWKSHAERFSLAATICILVGVGLFIGCMVLDRYVAQSDYIGLDHLSAPGLWTSIVLVYLVAPVLGVIAIWRVRANEQYVARRRDDPEGSKRMRRVAGRFLIASVLLVLVALFPIHEEVGCGASVLRHVGGQRRAACVQMNALWFVLFLFGGGFRTVDVGNAVL